MPYVNLIDLVSTTPGDATPGVYLDMRSRSRLSLTEQGVPVRMRVFATSTAAGDTGAVKIVDSNGADVLVVPIVGSTGRWYVTDGYLPATDSKYDVQFGGNTTATLSVEAFSLYEWFHDGAIEGSLSASIGEFTLLAEGTVGVAWTEDATSGKGVPTGATEVAASLTDAGLAYTAASQWDFDEPSGNVTDNIGSKTLTATGTLAYDQAIAGWDRNGITFTEDTAGKLQHATGVSDVSTTSGLLFLYVKLTAPAGATAGIVSLGEETDSKDFSCEINTTPRLVGESAANSTTGTADPTGSVIPLVMRNNQTANTVTIFTEAEKITITQGSMNAGTALTIGGDGGALTLLPTGFTVTWGLRFDGAQAEWSDAEVKAYLETLNWSPPWS